MLFCSCFRLGCFLLFLAVRVRILERSLLRFIIIIFIYWINSDNVWERSELYKLLQWPARYIWSVERSCFYKITLDAQPRKLQPIRRGTPARRTLRFFPKSLSIFLFNILFIYCLLPTIFIALRQRSFHRSPTFIN